MLQEKNLEIVARFRNSLVHFFKEGKLFFSSRNKIYQISDLKKPRPEVIGEMPWPLYKNISNIRIIDRCLKNSILQAHKTKNGGYLVATGNKWWFIDKEGYPVEIEKFTDTRPMCRGICESNNGIIYVAEYNTNANKQLAKIFRSKDCRSFDVAWEFLKGEIRHVHALILDPELENRIWILTGDADNESRIFYTDDDFSSLQCFLSAGQKSRATDLIIRGGQLYWGTDSPIESSFIMRADKKSPNLFEKIGELPGPAYYMTQNKAGGIYLGTTVEPGPAVKDNYGHIFGLRPDNSWREMARFKKDIFPQYGILYFPKGVLPENFIVFSQRALEPFEGYLTIARDKAW